MSRRPGAAALVAALLILALAGCGGGRPAPAGLAWQGEPHVFQPRGLPRDRVLVARIRNRGSTMLTLLAAQVTVLDAGGRPIPHATAGFLMSYAHGLYGALQQPSAIPRTEAARLGRLLYLFGGQSAPFFAAWHLPPGVRDPASIEIGRFRLAVPRGAPQLTAR